MVMERKIRVLVTKIGLDGHDRGAKVIAYGLRDAGFEVIFLGVRQTPDQVVNTAIQEDVDVVGLSILSGAHMPLAKRVLEKLKEKGGEDIIVLIGGLIPEEDKQPLKEMGVVEVFTSGTDIIRVAEVINQHVKAEK
ncbi:MAG: cobalamin B12-binding domain-containing protein [Deltaproteobacteria bacterium]|nr:cobalamin B12-binding domain-containing protein [Deltaproteobacteria bacterium]MBW2051077.1 cobalamin B12-binding domain-containing protein [Deltaproteobacteria bacterium]MBW2141055.1 cobalamin B12-binding domain-containing protein [Deltaproteobacteria bacterium]MBW2322587.1 cobalamin B12-binding domain-containing protein [Deltaproteobacteria bacterium]